MSDHETAGQGKRRVAPESGLLDDVSWPMFRSARTAVPATRSVFLTPPTESKKLVRFGKPISDLLPHKSAFVQNNNELLNRAKRFADLYRRQPKRVACMSCEAPLGTSTFVKLGIDYSICGRCGHLNGHHVDTDEFCATLYTSDGGKDYAKVYGAADKAAYEARVRDIYAPKASFLLEALRMLNESPEKLTFTDLGAGSGYMIAALADQGVTSQGYEVSASQIEFAKAMRPKTDIILHETHEVYGLARDVRANVVSMIGVLEHLQRPRELLAALRDNNDARYLYLSVPLMSLTVYLELGFPNVMPRHLTGGHTHLYTEKSLDHLCNEFGFERVAEWWFGLDIADFYRSLLVTFGSAADALLPLIDSLQSGVDRTIRGSEVHMLLRID